MGFKNVLKSMFPFIAAASTLGGPLGIMAASAVGTALGVDKVDATPEGIANAITKAQASDPDVLLKLKQVEADFQLQMATLGYDTLEKLEHIDAEDRANARAREIAVKDKVPATLAFVVTAGFFGLLGMLAYKDIPASSETILNVMVGSLGTAWIGIVNYYFGSSSGSAAKTKLLAQAEK